MTEIPLHLPHIPTPGVPGWVRDVFAGRISQRMTEVTEPLHGIGSVVPEVPESTPVFESRFHLSSEEQRQLTKDTLAYNAIKDTPETMTDRDEHARVMGIYDGLKKRYADPSRRGSTIPDEAYRRSITPVLYASPFRQIETVSPAFSPALGD